MFTDVCNIRVVRNHDESLVCAMCNLQCHPNLLGKALPIPDKHDISKAFIIENGVAVVFQAL